MADATDDLPTVRLGELVEALRVALGGGRGWGAAAAELLRVTPAYVYRLTNPEDSIRVGSDVIRRIGRAHGIPAAFFEDPEHARSARTYAQLLVPQRGLALDGEEVDPRVLEDAQVVDALNDVIRIAQDARAAVIGADDRGGCDALAAAAGRATMAIAQHRARRDPNRRFPRG